MQKLLRPFLQTALCLSLLGTQSMSFAAYQISPSPSNETNSSSESVCSLREAVTMVNSQSFGASTNCIVEAIEGDVDRIILGAGTYKLTSTLNVTQSLQLQGQPAGLTTIDGGKVSTILVFDDQSTSQRSITLENLNIINGGINGFLSKSDVGALSSTENLLLNHVSISSSFGQKASAISIDGATLSVLNSVFSDNTRSASVIAATGSSSVSITNTRLSNNEFFISALLLSNVTNFEINQSEISMNTGRGEAVSGSLGLLGGSEGRLINSTLANNSAKLKGGSGLYVNASRLEIRNSTIIMNTDASSRSNTYTSGLLAENGASVTLINSVLAANTDDFGHPSDCSIDESSQISSNSFNVVGDTSRCGNLASDGDSTVNIPTELALLALSNQGGSTQTLVPLPDSPLLDSAKNEDCPETDQRGFSRPVNNQCDIGAVEMQGAPQADDIEPFLKVVGTEKVDILSHVSRRESDIDPKTLEVTANFNHNEEAPEDSEGTYQITRNNILKFSPGEAFDGEVSFTYSVSDIHGRESQAATIVLKNADPIAPEAVDDYYKAEGKEYLQLDVLDNDVRGSSNYDLSTMRIENGVKYGRLVRLSLSGVGGSSFIYTPDRDSSGVDSFTYSIATREGQRSNIATVTIELASPNTGGDDDDGLGGLNLFMVLGLFGLVLSRRLDKSSV